MITEDYCSFELSILLKEKGFDLHDTKELYVTYKNGYCIINNPHTKNYCTDEFPKVTHQMALKWLREVHNIDVCVCRELNEYGECLNGYIATIYKKGIYKDTTNIAEDSTYEEATEYAIKYCLINLIK